MKKNYSFNKCPKCGGQLVIIEIPTFDGKITESKCRECDYFITD